MPNDHTSRDLHGIRAFPIVPGEQLGGFRIGSNISEYRELLLTEQKHRFFHMASDYVRQDERPWGKYRPTWGIEITIWPVNVHVDIRDGSIYRVEAQPGYEAGYNGITIGQRWTEARLLEPTLDWNDFEQALAIPGVDGLYFALTEDDPIGREEYLLQLQINNIGVYDAAKGTTLPF